MGLDSWLFAIDPKFTSSYKKSVDDARAIEITYWRKHHELHRWMERLYHKRGGEEEFNLVKLFLSKDDLDRLEQDVIKDKVPRQEGFFYSAEEAKQYDLDAITCAKQHIALGYLVYYNSWW